MIVGFYGGLALLLLLVVTDNLRRFAPDGSVTSIAHNSEAYLFALVLAAWVQFVRPKLQGQSSRVRWSWTLGTALAWALVAFGFTGSDLPSRVKTLDEAAYALAVLIPYVMLRRPLSRWVLAIIPALIAMTIWGIQLEPDGWTPEPQGWIVDQAEMFGLIMLAVIAFDVIDRGMLDPHARTNVAVRWCWYAFLALEVAIVSALGTEARMGDGVLPKTLEWLGRVHESFIGILAVSLLLAVVLGRTGCRDDEGARREVSDG